MEATSEEASVERRSPERSSSAKQRQRWSSGLAPLAVGVAVGVAAVAAPDVGCDRQAKAPETMKKEMADLAEALEEELALKHQEEHQAVGEEAAAGCGKVGLLA